MNIKEELELYKLDPGKSMRALVDTIEAISDGELVLVDPTNPFVMSLEATAVTTANAIQESNVLFRRSYPSLSTEPEDLFHHMADAEEYGIFATPSETILRFMVNKQELITYGIRNEEQNTYEIVIPSETVVTVSNTQLTTLNQIHILLAGNVSYVENSVGKTEASESGIGNLNSKTISDNNGIEWIVFDTLVKQVSVESHEELLLRAVHFSKEYELEDKYYTCEIAMKSILTNNEWEILRTSHSDIIFDPEVPTIAIRYLNNKLRVTIPRTYLMSKKIEGELRITIYTTKGDITLPLNKFGIDDFTTDLGPSGQSFLSLPVDNITILAFGRHTLDSGSNNRTMTEMRDKIVTHSTGLLDIPITEYEIIEKGRLKGYNVIKVLDLVTERNYVASKNFTKVVAEDIETVPEGFMNTVRLFIPEINNDEHFLQIGDGLVITSNTIFKNENGIMTILPIDEEVSLINLSNTQLIMKVTEADLFFTPFYYMLDKKDTVFNTRIYDLDSPRLEDLVIVNKNTSEGPSVNVDRFVVSKHSLGYEVTFTLIVNSGLSDTDVEGFYIQLKLPIENSDEGIFYHLSKDDNNFYTVVIETDHYVDDCNKININNGDCLLSDVSCKIHADVEIIIYTEELFETALPYDPTNELLFHNFPTVTALTKQKITLIFGDHLEYLWDNVNLNYSSRKFLSYNNDQFAYYDEDIYERNPETGEIFTLTDETGDGFLETIDYNILHNKGDQMFDELGDPIYIHREGELIKDENNNFIIDLDAGLERYLDVYMLEYDYRASGKVDHRVSINTAIQNLKSWLLIDLVTLNEEILEQTTIYYRPPKSIRNNKILKDQIVYSIPHRVSPVITIYEQGQELLNAYGITQIRSIIGKIIHSYLSRLTWTLSDIKSEIIETLLGGTIKGIRIEGLSYFDQEITKTSDETNRISIKKKLDSLMDVTYQIQITIEHI